MADFQTYTLKVAIFPVRLPKTTQLRDLKAISTSNLAMHTKKALCSATFTKSNPFRRPIHPHVPTTRALLSRLRPSSLSPASAFGRVSSAEVPISDIRDIYILECIIEISAPRLSTYSVLIELSSPTTR